MGPVEKLRNIFNKEEIREVNRQNELLLESIHELCDGIKSDYHKQGSLKRYADNRLELTKNVICECMENLYMDSLVIDNPERYSDSLRSQMHNECMSIMESAKSVGDLKAMFENSSNYIKNILVLAETICDKKDPDELKESDIATLSPFDLNLIEEFEKDEGRKDYGEEIQNRVVQVFDKERENAEERRSKINGLVDLIASKSDTPEQMSESVEKGINYFSNEPSSLFNSIFINKSKMLINENAEDADLSKCEDLALAETICTYTLLECIHALGFKTYTDDEVRSMKYKFFTGRE